MTEPINKENRLHSLTGGRMHVTDLSTGDYNCGPARCQVCKKNADCVNVRPEPEVKGWPGAFDSCKDCVRELGFEVKGRPGRYEFNIGRSK